MSLIERYVQQTRPLERAYLRHHDGLTGLVMEHRRITALLKGGDLAGAAAVLRASLSSGVEPTLDWLREAQPTPADMKR